MILFDMYPYFVWIEIIPGITGDGHDMLFSQLKHLLAHHVPGSAASDASCQLWIHVMNVLQEDVDEPLVVTVTAPRVPAQVDRCQVLPAGTAAREELLFLFKKGTKLYLCK